MVEGTQKIPTSHAPCDPGLLQSYLDEALSPDQRDACARHLEACASCREELALLREAGALVADAMSLLRRCAPPTLTAQEVLHTASLQERSAAPKEAASLPSVTWRAWLMKLVAPQWGLAGLTVVALFLVPLLYAPSLLPTRAPSHRGPKSPGLVLPRPQPDLITKGWRAEMLYAHLAAAKPSNRAVQSYGASHKVSHGDVLYPYDLVQFAYQLPAARHVMIVGMSAQGEVFPLLVSPQQTSLSAKGKGVFPRGHSFQLDHYIGIERYFFLTAKASFSLAAVKQALRAAWSQRGRDLRKPLVLPRRWQSTSWLIQKKKRF